MSHNAHCDYCQRPTSNERDADDELRCHQCRHAEAKRQRGNGQLRAATHAALAKLPAALNDRIHKAHDLALSGYVSRNGAGYIVKSQTGNGTYHVNRHGCDCLDAAHRAPKIGGRPACKHQIAVWLVKKNERQSLQTTDARERSQPKTTNAEDSTRKHGAVKPGTLNGKDFIAWCKHCKAETKFGFGLGCLSCIERYEQRKQRETALPAPNGYNERQLRHAAETGTSAKLWK